MIGESLHIARVTLSVAESWLFTPACGRCLELDRGRSLMEGTVELSQA
jgi:hypothetical protein